MSEPPSMTFIFVEYWQYREPPAYEQLWQELWGYEGPSGIGESYTRILSPSRILSSDRVSPHRHLRPPLKLIPIELKSEDWGYSEPPSMSLVKSEDWSGGD